MKNLTEYITEAGFDSNAQMSKNREIINKYFTDFTISAAFPIKRQKNYKKYFDYMYRCEISKKEEIDKFYDALCRMYDETGQEYKQKDIDRRKEIDKNHWNSCLELNKELAKTMGISPDSMPVQSLSFSIRTNPDF